ncbi:MAG: glycosyltransferase family 2 protein [bacterium]|nr:glycosyltransferase family 2 protein [bacterium]
MDGKIHLSVIIPAYNEQETLPATLASVSDYLKKQNFSYEIIVINDASKDRTAAVVGELLGKIANLKLIDEKINRGKGSSVKKGILEASGDFRLFMDADNATTIDQVEGMWPEFEKGADVVIGSRDIEGADIVVAQPWWRILMGNIFNLIVQIIVGLWGIKDTQCGFKGFRAAVAEDIFSRCKIDRWAFDVEVLLIAKKFGYKIKEIPVRWVNNPNSKVSFKGMVKMLLEVLKIRWNAIKGAYGR